MAVKKKSAAKRVVKKAPAKRTAKKVAKKSTAKKAPAKRTAKKVVAKKRVAKKSAAKKAPAKRTAKKTVKKSVAVKVAKPPVVVSATPFVSVSTTPMPPKPVAVAPKPVVAPKQGTSGRVVFLVVVGIAILAAIVWSKSGNESDDGATPSPSISQSVEPTETATAEPTETATAEPTETAVAVTVIEAPTKFVALKSADGLTLRWVAPMATDGLTGYNVELRANGIGEWMVIATVPADQLTQGVTKSANTGWTQFRVTSVYADGQVASATVFGIPGEFK